MGPAASRRLRQLAPDGETACSPAWTRPLAALTARAQARLRYDDAFHVRSPQGTYAAADRTPSATADRERRS